MKNVYESDIKLGERYRDQVTGLEGMATSVHFYRNACERVVITYANKGEVMEFSSDSVDLVHVETGQKATSEKTGGPARSMPSRR